MKHVLTKKHDEMVDFSSSTNHQVIGKKQLECFDETQVDLISQNKDLKSREDQIVVYNHIESMASKEKKPFLYYIPTPKNEVRIPHDLLVYRGTNRFEMHEFKHVKQIPTLLDLVNYSYYYSHINQLSFLHTIKELPHLDRLERMNSESPLNVYRYLLDQDFELVFENFKESFKKILQHPETDLKRDFNIDLSKYEKVDLTSNNKKEQINQLMKDP